MKFEENSITSLKSNIDSLLQNIEFNVEFITLFAVRKIIYKLDVNKATGLDKIGPSILKYCGDAITPSIAAIINNSISAVMQ